MPQRQEDRRDGIAAEMKKAQKHRRAFVRDGVVKFAIIARGCRVKVNWQTRWEKSYICPNLIIRDSDAWEASGTLPDDALVVLTPMILKKFHSLYQGGCAVECWEWLGRKSMAGYGMIGSDNTYAHRLAYQIHNKEIRHSMLVCHTCDNRGCVNPSHLYLGTHKDNAGDMVKRARNSGERSARPKLTWAQVDEIKSKHIPYKLTYAELAKEYGVSSGCIGAIVRGTNWSNRG